MPYFVDKPKKKEKKKFAEWILKFKFPNSHVS